MIFTVLIFVAVLSLLVLVHEYGHFAVARRCGVHVEEFAFGFPPRAFGVKKGRTFYAVNWVPLGGYVRIKGELGDHAGDKDSFAAKSRLQKALILAAGVGMNLVLAWFLLSVGYIVGLPQVVDETPAYSQLSEVRVRVGSVLAGSPAAKGGLLVGDAIMAVDGQTVNDIEFLRKYTADHDGRTLALVLERDGKPVATSVTPIQLAETGRPGIGVALMRTALVSYPFYLAPIQAVGATWSFAREIVVTFAGFLRDLFVRHEVTAEFSGPVGIAVITSEVAKLGFRYLIQFTALLSVNLAIINILPFPALDGGRLFFLAIEAIRGRALDRRFEAVAHNIGFALLILLIMFVTYKDVTRFGGGILTSLFGH